MSADNGRHEIGDIVTPTKETYVFSDKRRPIPKGLEDGKHYTIIAINRGLDAAIDWDDVFLESINGMFCEFDLDTVRRGK